MSNKNNQSPFHKGELAIQKMYSASEKMELVGAKMIRDFMPQQHQDFFSKLQFVVLGYSDQAGNAWVSLLTNETGVLDIVDDKTLQLNFQPLLGDPLNCLLDQQPTLGLLGIELATRRRNRLSVKVEKQNKQGLLLTLRQSFGNCPQFITPRDFYFLASQSLQEPSISPLSCFDLRAIDLIKNCDTFFVSSFITDKHGDASEGADVSHRGGKPGFIRIDSEHQLTIPDYRGNIYFNTFGNFRENGRAGLLFIDFENGHMLSVSGQAEVLWKSDDIHHFEGAQCLWSFRIQQGLWLNNSLNIRWEKGAMHTMNN